MREERSPSFFNTSEVSVVLNYVEELLQARKGGMKLKPEDIGIISPYRKQVCFYSGRAHCMLLLLVAHSLELNKRNTG